MAGNKKKAASKAAAPLVTKKAEKAPPAKAEKTPPAKAEKAPPAKVEKTPPAKAEKTPPAKAEKTPPAKEAEQKTATKETGKAAASKQAAAPIAKRKAKAPAAPEGAAQASAASSEAPKGGEAKKTGRGGRRRTLAKRLEKAQAAVEKQGDKPKDVPKDQPRGVIYLGHIPTGFFEPQMRKFFSQFGEITRLRLSRSKKNAVLKGFGWVEFADQDVAKVVQQTMNGYLLYGKKLKCELVPKDKQHPALFKGCRKKMVNRENARRSQFKRTYNNRPTAEVEGEVVPRETTRQHARRGKSSKKLSDKLEALGVKFDLASVLDGAAEGEDLELGDVAKKAKAAKGTKRQAEPVAAAPAKEQKQKQESKRQPEPVAAAPAKKQKQKQG